MNYLKNIILGFIGFASIYSCEQQTIDVIETKTAIVEGFLHANMSLDSLLITQSFSYTQVESEIITLDDLVVTLSDDSNEYVLNSIGDGVYQDTNLIIEYDQSYRIEFEWEGKTVSAETYIPLKTEAELSIETVEIPKVEVGPPTMGTIPAEVDPIEIKWENNQGDYYYIVIENMDEDPEYINGNIEANLGTDRPRFVFITEPQITDFYAVDARRELTQYGLHQVIVFRVNPEYAALYESSGNSTLSLEEPPTNIENGLGIFTGVSSDTLFLQVNEL